MTHVPTADTRTAVVLLASGGVAHKRISRLLKITEKTLYLHYREELDCAFDSIAELAIGVLVKSMKTGGPREAMASAMFWCKTRLGWRERAEFTGADGGPVQLIVTGVRREIEIPVDGQRPDTDEPHTTH